MKRALIQFTIPVLSIIRFDYPAETPGRVRAQNSSNFGAETRRTTLVD
jgi:hypothetical protein